MRRYLVRFFYYSDMRHEWEGEARGDLEALVMATSLDDSLRSWCDVEGFRIEISYKGAQ